MSHTCPTCGAPRKMTPDEQLYALRQTGSLAEVKAVVQAGASLNRVDKNGWTPLHHACRWNQREGVVAYMLEQGACANATDLRGETPLHIAVSCGYLDEVVALIKHGARVNAKTDLNATPLDLCNAETIEAVLANEGAFRVQTFRTQ